MIFYAENFIKTVTTYIMRHGPILVSFTSVAKSFGVKKLFQDLSFTIYAGEKIGLIGANGAGKSTLFHILIGQQDPDQGLVTFGKGCRVGHLAQDPVFEPGQSIWDALTGSQAHGDDTKAWSMRAHELIGQLQLGQPDTKVETLSGGWRKKVAFARAIMSGPDLLLLDEPTNHLDLQSIMALEQWIKKQSIACLVITHDRLFLENTCECIMELDRRHDKGIFMVPGGYEAYLRTRDQQIAASQRQEQALRNTLTREMQWAKTGAKARTTKQQARLQRAYDLQDEVRSLQHKNKVLKVSMDFHQQQDSPKKLIEARKVGYHIDGKHLFSGVNLTLQTQSRVAIVGPNGSGKSSLLEILLGQREPSLGSVTRFSMLSVAYFDQTRASLDAKASVLYNVCPEGETVWYQNKPMHIRSYLGKFLLDPKQLMLPVGSLSGGEQNRVLLAKLMLTSAHLLVLDEPTNDLDLDTLFVLEECLMHFAGAILLVSHDRSFVNRVADQIIGLGHPHGVVGSFASLEQWQQWWDTIPSTLALKQTLPSGELKSKLQPKKRLSAYQKQVAWKKAEQKIIQAEERLGVLQIAAQQENMLADYQKLAQTHQEIADVLEEIESCYQFLDGLEKEK